MHHHTSRYSKHHIGGLVHDCSFSVANALVILQFCTKMGVIHNIHQTYTQDKERYGREKFNPLIRETMMTSWHRNALCIACPSRGISLATIIFRSYIYIYIYIYMAYKAESASLSGQWGSVSMPWHLNPLRAKFLRVNTNIYLQFMSFLHTNKTQVIEIPPPVRQGPAYST